MQVTVLLRMELMTECLLKQPAFQQQESSWSPSLSKFLPQWHSMPSTICIPVWRAIAKRSSSGPVTDLRIGHGLGSRAFRGPAQLFPMMTQC